MPNDLKEARLRQGLSQEQAAKRLGVTQAYLSMLENGRRAAAPLARKLMHLYDLPATVLPPEGVEQSPSPEKLAGELSALGYPGFAHLGMRARRVNPAGFLLSAVAQPNLEARTAEGLPWLVLQYPDLPADWLVRESRVRNLQNRVGFVVTLAREAGRRADLEPLERTLADSKLEKEDTFCKELNDAERRWLRENRSEQARRWNLLSDIRPETLRYVHADAR